MSNWLTPVIAHGEWQGSALALRAFALCPLPSALVEI
jgi:hypothetical protein